MIPKYKSGKTVNDRVRTGHLMKLIAQIAATLITGALFLLLLVAAGAVLRIMVESFLFGWRL